VATAARHIIPARYRRFVEQVRDRLVAPASVWDELPRARDLADPRAYWQGVRLFRELHGGGYTMASSRRGRTLFRLARDVERRGIPGDLVDCGVWNGGSTVLLSAGARSREVWAFDSFEGLPEPGPLDGAESNAYVGECVGSEEMVRDAFARYANLERLHIVKGWFAETFPSAAPRIASIAVLHADGDWYESVLLTLETFYPKLNRGGYVVIDDYGHWKGARTATDEFRRAQGIASPMRTIDYTGRYWQKLE
jgi:O-methyltransferase